jgi:hypothetical protein
MVGQCIETHIDSWQGKYCTLSAPPSLNSAANPFGAVATTTTVSVKKED